MTWILKVLACVSLQGEASQAWHVPGPLHCCGASPAEPEAEWQKAGAVLFRQGQVRFIQCIVYGSFLRSYVFPQPKSSHQIRPWYIINSTTVVNFWGVNYWSYFYRALGPFSRASVSFLLLSRQRSYVKVCSRYSWYLLSEYIVLYI